MKKWFFGSAIIITIIFLLVSSIPALHDIFKREKYTCTEAIIDRFEGDMAVILIGEDEIKVEIPRQHLSQGAREGSRLKLNFALDPEETGQQEERIDKLLYKLRSK